MVIQRRERLCLTHEPRETIGIGGECLERHVAIGVLADGFFPNTVVSGGGRGQ